MEPARRIPFLKIMDAERETVATAMKLTAWEEHRCTVAYRQQTDDDRPRPCRSKSSTTSSVYEINSIRPSTEPCGTLQQTVKEPLRSSPDIKVCVRPERYNWNQDNATPATEKRSLKMDVRQYWSTVSKVELRSRRTSGTTSPRSSDRTMSL